MEDKTGEELKEDLKRLEEKLLERKKALPAHSVRAHQLMEIEELEDRIKQIKDDIKRKGQTKPLDS